MNEFLSLYDSEVQKVHDLMISLKHPKSRIRLASAVPLTPETEQATRWGSTYTMLAKYLRLYPHFSDCGFPEDTRAMIPDYHEHNDITDLCKKLEEFQVISKWLQSTDGSIKVNGQPRIIPVNHFNIRTSFDSLISRYPSMERHLAKNAAIVHCPDFENAVAKVQAGLPFNRYTTAEKKAIGFYVEIAEESIEEEENSGTSTFESLAAMVAAQTEAEERVKRGRLNGQVKSIKHLAPTSVIVENFFSDAKRIMTDQRRLMDPSTLETLLMLKLNKDLWDARDIERLRREFAEERAAERRLILPTPPSRIASEFLSASVHSSASSSYFDGAEEED